MNGIAGRVIWDIYITHQLHNKYLGLPMLLKHIDDFYLKIQWVYSIVSEVSIELDHEMTISISSLSLLSFAHL